MNGLNKNADNRRRETGGDPLLVGKSDRLARRMRKARTRFADNPSVKPNRPLGGN